MTALNPAAHTIPEGEELVPTAKAPKATEASIALRQKSVWASLIAALIAILWTIPTVGLLITSFRPAADIRRSGWWTVWQDPSVHPEQLPGRPCSAAPPNLASYFVNSLVITIPAVVIPISIACMAAYGFAWMNFRGARFLFVAVFALQIVPDPGDADPAAHPLRRRRARRHLLADLDRAQHLRPPAGDLPAAQLHERAAQGARRGRAGRRCRPPDDLLQDHDAR